MTALFPHLPFDAAETPLSFAVRLAALHTGGGVTPFLTDMSIRTDRLVRGDEASVRRLASVAGVAPEALIANTPIAVESRRFVLRGFDISSEFLSSPATVFCPACLLADDARDPRPGVGRRGRLSWTLRPVRTCPEHGIALIHRAPGPREPKLMDLSTRVPEQDADLERLIETCEPRSVSPLQSYLEHRIDGAAGPAWLDAQALEQAVRACEMLGALLEFGPSATLKAFSPCDWDRAGRAGFAAAAQGEPGIHGALSHVQARFRTKGRQPGTRKVFGRLYEWLAGHRPEKAPGDIKRILREHVFATMEMEAGRELLGAALDRRRLHSVGTLAAETGLDRRTLRNVLAARGLVGQDPEALYDVFDAEAGRAVAASVQRVVHAIGLPRALNCSRPQADALVDERVLSPLAEGPGRGVKHRAVDARDVEALLALLAEEVPVVPSTPAGLVPVAKAAEKARATGIEILHLVLGGFLSGARRLEKVASVGALLVAPTSSAR